MKKLKILMIVSNLNASDGVSSYAMNYLRNINHNKICMDFVLYFNDMPVDAYKKEIRNLGGQIFVLPRFANVVEHYKKCKEIIINGEYDIVHDNSLIITYPIMFCAKQQHIPIRILHSHNSKLGETSKKEKRNKLFLPLLKSLATNYVACSEMAGKAMFGKKSFDFIPNVISADRYKFDVQKRQMIRQQMNVREKFIIVTVGRVSKQKNPFFAMDVFQKVAKKDSNAEYWWIGSGPLDNELEQYVEKLGLSNKVKLFGSRHDIVDLYQAADVFFLPSLFEGLPVTGVEAQAMGLPCVISEKITKEVVYTNLVEYVDLNQGVDEWCKVLISKKLVIRHGYEKELEQSVFSDKKAGENLLNLYTKMIEET